MNPNSTTKEIAKSGVFKIVEMLKVGENDVDALIDVSMVLSKKYGDKSILTKSTIEKYFNRSGSISFIAIYQHEIIGYIIGIPIEKLSREPWLERMLILANPIPCIPMLLLSKKRSLEMDMLEC